MLTRIEIDGFKTFTDFHLDVTPFMVVVGANASGKSNLFDAVRLLSRLAEADIRSAVRGLRGEPHELLRRLPDGSVVTRMTLAVDVLLAPEVRDPWGTTVKITHSRVRYEVALELRRDERGIERLSVVSEQALPILAAEDRWPAERRPSPAFRQAYVHYRRRTPWLSMTKVDGRTGFEIHHDGHAGRTRPAEAAESTVLASVTSAEFPHLYALREELRSWRFLQLDPGALRRPSPTTGEDVRLDPDGSNLATVLARIQAETRTPERPLGVVADIAADLSSLVPGVAGLTVAEDQQNREYRIDIAMRDGAAMTSRVASDGTLRILALLTLLHDPQHGGLVCFEEPENGVHPARLKGMIRRLRMLAADVRSESGDVPLTQILMTSHSPVVVSTLEDGEVVFAEVTAVAGGGSTTDHRTKMRPVVSRGTVLPPATREYVSTAEVEHYLATVNRER